MSEGTEPDPSLPATGTDERSRRQLLSGGGTAALGGAALLLAGCTSKVKQPSHVPISPKTPHVKRDIKILNGLLALEYRSIYAYTAAIPLFPKPPPPKKSDSKPSPPPPKQPSDQPPPPLVQMVPLSYTAAQTFQSQELAHVTELKGFIRQGGGRAEKPAPSYDLGHPKTKQDVLMLLHGIEEALLKAYLKAAPQLTPKQLRGAVAAIFANHTQHTTILRLELGLPPTPSAFVTGPE